MKRRTFLELGTGALGATLLGPPPLSGAPEATGVYPLTYPLRDGWVDHWLLAGPHVTVIPDAPYKWNAALREPIVKRFASAEAMVTPPFVEGAEFTVENARQDWRYWRCEDDHLIDLAKWYGSARYLRAWAAVELDGRGPAARDAAFHLWTNGPAEVFLGGRHVHHADGFDFVNPRRSEFRARLEPGPNTLLVRFDLVVGLGGAFSLGLQLRDLPAPDAVAVRVLTRTPNVAVRQALETALTQASMSRDSYGGADRIHLLVPRLSARDTGVVRVELRAGGKVVRAANWDTAEAGTTVPLGAVGDLPAGKASVLLTAAGNRRELGFRVHAGAFDTVPAPGSTHAARRQTVLEAAARRTEGARIDSRGRVNLWDGHVVQTAVARMALGRWEEVAAGTKTLLGFIEAIARVEDGADFQMLEMLGIVFRFGEHPRFPAELRAPLEKCVLGFRYWRDEPGVTSANYNSENHQLAFHASEILAGQLFPDRVFVNNGKTGAWHRQHGEELALEWLQRRAGYGFEEWDANGYLVADLNLLSHLSTLAANPTIRRLARVVMDKIHLSFALNSFRGCFGSTHGRTAVDYIKDARNEPVARAAWLAWGVGGLGDRADSVVALAMSGYEPPAVIRGIALDQPEAMWSRERQGLDPKLHAPEAAGPTDKVTFKTPDFMLCSAQSWRPGQDGYQQHIWQATLGPEAVVFGTHPACISEDGNRRPNFWTGNQTLPRVAQWRDTLVAMHRLRETDWLDFTHAWFPTFAFDEHDLAGGWAFARQGDGFLAITAARGLKLIDYGDSARRELRSTGRENVWLVQMGRAAVNGPFAEFRRQVLALPKEFRGLSTQFTTLRGDRLEFGWEGPLRVNGKAEPIADFKHLDSPYGVADWPATKLEIRHGGENLTLDLTGEAAG